MKNVTIPQPCSENFNAMTPTERGSFCDKCATDTFNFTDKNSDEIKKILRTHIGQHICGRITKEQEEVLNREFEQWSFKSVKSFQSAFLFTLIAVFGLGLFSCADQRQEQDIINFQKTASSIMAQNQKWKNDIPSIEDEEITQLAKPANLKLMEKVYAEELIEIDYRIPYEIDEQEVVIYDNYRTYGGAMYISSEFHEFLIETTPLVVEYDERGIEIPREFSSLAYPNPTTDNSTIQIKVPVSGEFQIDLYDMNGKFQQSIYAGSIERGTFEQSIEMTDLPPGMYLVTILSKNYKETVRISKT